MNKDNNSEDTVLTPKKQKTRSTVLLKDKGLLVILSNNFFGETFIIDKHDITIGRNKSCEIIIEDPLISNQHCRIYADKDNRFFITDLESSNLTYLNKKTLKKDTQLHYGDRIVIGNTVLRFFLEEETEGT